MSQSSPKNDNIPTKQHKEVKHGTIADTYARDLANRLQIRSDELENIHMQAAIDAELTMTESSPQGSNSNPLVPPQVVRNTAKDGDSTSVDPSNNSKLAGDANNIHAEKDTRSSDQTDSAITSALQDHKSKEEEPIFDHYQNPNSVHNCLSPYVPTSHERIGAIFNLLGLTKDDVLLDIGCGDGRVCISAAKTIGCRVIGLDVSPACIKMAKSIAKEEGLCSSTEQPTPSDKKNGSDESPITPVKDLCNFYEVDATIDPNILLSNEKYASSTLRHMLKDVTVIFLYTYPTLLYKLKPLLSRLTQIPMIEDDYSKKDITQEDDGIKEENEETYSVRSIVTLTYHLPKDQVKIEKRDEEHDLQVYSQVFDK